MILILKLLDKKEGKQSQIIGPFWTMQRLKQKSKPTVILPTKDGLSLFVTTNSRTLNIYSINTFEGRKLSEETVYLFRANIIALELLVPFIK